MGGAVNFIDPLSWCSSWLVTFGRVEDAVGLLVADVAALRLAVVLQSAGLAEIMSAPDNTTRVHLSPLQLYLHTVVLLYYTPQDSLRYNWVLERLSTDEALEREILVVAAHLVVFLVWELNNGTQVYKPQLFSHHLQTMLTFSLINNNKFISSTLL